MLLVPFPLGFLVPGRGTAYLAYVAVHAFVFPFQTLVLLLDWVNGAEAAFDDRRAGAGDLRLRG